MQLPMLGFEALTDTPIGGEMRTSFRAAKVREGTFNVALKRLHPA
jgi:hypothetical protein